MHNQSTTLDIKYLQAPNVTAPCGSAEDKVQFLLSGHVRNGAIVQEVTRIAHIQRNGASTIATTELFYELWDVIVTARGIPIVMGNGVDEFAWHPQAGDKPGQPYDTKGSWQILGVVRFIPGLDVTQAIRQGENWQRGGIQGAGSWLYTLTQTPSAWNNFVAESARILKAQWNCFPNEPRQETDIAGSGPTTP